MDGINVCVWHGLTFDIGLNKFFTECGGLSKIMTGYVPKRRTGCFIRLYHWRTLDWVLNNLQNVSGAWNNFSFMLKPTKDVWSTVQFVYEKFFT